MLQKTSQGNPFGGNPFGIVIAGALLLAAAGVYLALDDRAAPPPSAAVPAEAPAALARDDGEAARFGGERELGLATDGEKALGEEASPSFGGARVRGKAPNTLSETEMLADQAARDAEYIGNGQRRSSTAARRRELREAGDWGQ